jgi:CRISPR-associated exonuclease Cas4
VILYLLAGMFLFVGLGLFWMGYRTRSSLPQGRLVYIDSRNLDRSPQTLYDPVTDLAGRPDYLLRKRRDTIPIEIKSSATPAQPHDGHILQLAAYCHLVETTFGRRPPYGVIQYRDRAFRIDNSRALRRRFFNTLRSIRQESDAAPARSHAQASRCRACGYNTSCDQAL